MATLALASATSVTAATRPLSNAEALVEAAWEAWLAGRGGQAPSSPGSASLAAATAASSGGRTSFTRTRSAIEATPAPSQNQVAAAKS